MKVKVDSNMKILGWLTKINEFTVAILSCPTALHDVTAAI
jgi:hypothetical protein